MKKTPRIEKQSATSIWPLRSLEAVRRLVSCVEATNYALQRQQILSAIALCSIFWLASLWLTAALAQAQDSPSNESSISVTWPATAQTFAASHLVVSMVDPADFELRVPRSSAARLTHRALAKAQNSGRSLLPSDEPGTEFAALAALASAPSSSLLSTIQAKSSGRTGAGSTKDNTLVYRLGPVNFVIKGLPSSFSVFSAGSGVTGARW